LRLTDQTWTIRLSAYSPIRLSAYPPARQSAFPLTARPPIRLPPIRLPACPLTARRLPRAFTANAPNTLFTPNAFLS